MAQHRDVLRSDIPQPPSARQDEDGGSPCPEDGDFFYARPDAAEIEEAISKFSHQPSGCVKWESDLCRGVMRARCYPFDTPKHRFHGMNPKVLYIPC